MNYIKELNAFYDWLETNSLSTSAIALWHALMHINNKAGWAEEFGVASSVLCIKTGLADRTIRSARNELKQKGRIDWSSRKGNQSAIYKMISLVDTLPAPITDKHADKDIKKDENKDLPAIDADSYADNHADKCADSYADNHATLNKLNKTKQNETNITNNISLVANAFQQNGFGTINITVKEMLIELLEQYPAEWITEAMKVAVKANVRSLNYVEGILKKWNAGGGMKLEKDNKQSNDYDPYAHLEVIK